MKLHLRQLIILQTLMLLISSCGWSQSLSAPPELQYTPALGLNQTTSTLDKRFVIPSATSTQDWRFEKMTKAAQTRSAILTRTLTPTSTKLPLVLTQQALATWSTSEKIMEALPDRSDVTFQVGRWKITSTENGLFLRGIEDQKRIDLIYADQFGLSTLGDANYKASFIRLTEDGNYLYMGLLPPHWDTSGDSGYFNAFAIAQYDLTNGEMRFIFPENFNSENTEHYIYTASISPSGNLLVYASGPRFIRFVNLQNNQKFHAVFDSEYDFVRGFKWSPNGTKVLYSAGIWFFSPMDPHPVKESLFLLDLDTLKTMKIIDDAGLFGDYSFSISDDLLLTIENLNDKTTQEYTILSDVKISLPTPTP
jgi:WD40 repeat protein